MDKEKRHKGEVIHLCLYCRLEKGVHKQRVRKKKIKAYEGYLVASSKLHGCSDNPHAEFYRPTSHTEDQAFALCILHGKAGSLEQPRCVPRKAKM